MQQTQSKPNSFSLTSLKRWLSANARWGVIGVPYFWLLLFFAIPFVIVLKISFSTAVISMPPFTSLLNFTDGAMEITLKFFNYNYLLDDAIYYEAYLNSARLAFFSTLIALAIGYPLAYLISRMDPVRRNIFLMLVILPSWTSFLIRIYAWIGILKNNGLINNALASVGLIDLNDPLHMLHSDFAIYVGIVYAYLPFMVLPLYSVLEKQDTRLLQAAADLGATPIVAFWRITLPLSIPGIVSGCMLVFIPALGEFVIPALLGGSDTLMIGKVLWQEFFNNRDWPVASAVAVVMLCLILIPIAWFHSYQARQIEAQAR